MRDSLPLHTELLSYLEPNAPEPSGEDLARILLEIAAHEIEEGGPYACDPAQGLKETDLDLNIGIASFLRTLDVRLPKLDAYIEAHGGMPNTPAVPEVNAPAWNREELAILTEMREQIRWRLFTLPTEFRDIATQVVERTIKGNPDKQMSLMPLFLRQALGKQGRQFSDRELAALGLTNVFFWTAFIIYDDFWDEDEAAKPRLLPVANLFARQYTRFFSGHAPHVGLDSIFHEFMDKLDAANEWEILHCRLERVGNQLMIPRKLPQYGDFDIKFYPAAGHVVGPISMLLALGYGATSREVEMLTDYFRHYLIAMQLNDDAHDWKEDLGRGHISTAVFLLLGIWQAAHPERTILDLEHDMPELERLFWFKALPQLCEAILSRTERAQQALDSLEFIEDPRPLQQFIDRNREAAQRALDEQRRSIEFLEAMEQSTETQE